MGWLDEIGKSIPVEKIYDDLARKSVMEIGEIATNTVKAARCILAPIDYLAAKQDKLQRHLKRVNEKVPEERQINALPLITGPIIEGLTYVDEESLLSEMFENLLARAIDKDRVDEAHPAFSKIISQLAPDEAIILSHYKSESFDMSLVYIHDKEFGLAIDKKVIENEFPVENLIFPQNYLMYLDHLRNLNLLTIYNDFRHSKEDFPSHHQLCLQKTKLTDFGQLFTKACMP
ncbi:DUF4393 domain-containing protein [Marinomonas mediterranea]|uniref:DUF4393 domain-containing protein n=1 Tax=Marinomonas mediterranea TaxID=119864 RepID=UPI00234BA7F1|nr:DUF4393 domain-containing protein [Marinomonas mediterranea]WCN07605.1 DUF4393 domain-containing protein [Marinomonas mediterranea]